MKVNARIQRVTLIGSLFNIFLSILKIAGGTLFHSTALVADGVHSFSDLITDFAVLFGMRFWSKAPDSDHPYGHGRIETFVTLFIGVFLAGVAFFMGYNAVTGIIDYSPTSLSWVAFGIAIFSIVTKEALFRYSRKIGEAVNSRALIANAWHHRSDAFSSIPVALAVVASKLFPSLKYLDQIATILVSLFLLKASFDIARSSFEELMEKRDDVDLSGLLDECKSKYPKIKDFHKVNVRRVGAARYVDLHLQVPAIMTVFDSHSLAGKVKAELIDSKYGIQGVIVHIEPFEETK
ncbi:MAG: cation diffusion facilitator family transporter [Eubacteriales bacterium]